MSGATVREHTVFLEPGDPFPVLRYPPVFNVSVPFIDRHVGAGRGGRIALRGARAEVSYGELAANVARCGNALRSIGLQRGARLLMVVRDTPQFFYVFWGAIKAGIVPVAVNTLLRADDYRYLAEDSGCAAIVYSPELAGEVPSGAADLRLAGRPLPVLSTDEIDRTMQSMPSTLAPAPTRPDEDCFWLYSSGSTGKPKGVVHVHRDMVVTSERYAVETLGLRGDDVVFCASKLFFSYGFGGGMTFPLWVGATIVLCEERPSAEMALDMIERHRPTVFFGVPTLYGQMLHALEDRPRDLRSVRRAASAGEALPAAIFHKFREKTGISILDGIGSTEVLHIFISNRHDDIRPGTSGRLVPGYEVKIVDNEGNTVPPGEVGTLMVKGDSNARCYWNNPEKTAATMRGEWLNTGDMYSVDADGYYVNAGRGDDMFKVGAMWCSPLEIEGRLLQHPKVREAAVIGKTDADGMMKPAAFVVLRNAADANEAAAEELRQFCKSGLAGYKYPRWFTFVTELPKTVTGKIQRFKLRQGDAR
jgi:benzoate-CoA ligase family protein